MKQKGRNIAASVQARLLQLSRNSKLSLQDLLEATASSGFSTAFRVRRTIPGSSSRVPCS